MKIRNLLGALLFLCVFEASAATKDTKNATIELISIWTSNGNILVQTKPRADISGLTSTNNYWLTLNKNVVGHEATLALLMSAQASGAKVIVRADDSSGGQLCSLNRVVTQPPQ